MRVIAGSARGIRLAVPRDRATRPISDRVKEALFAILEPRLPGSLVLDLYAGSGAVGIEALSRGAEHCTFVERSRDVLAILRENLDRTGFANRARLVAGDVQVFLDGGNAGGIDLTVMDPPYVQGDILAPLERLAAQLKPGAMVVVKHFWRTPVPTPNGLQTIRSRRFGETALTFLEQTTDWTHGAGGAE